jgi:hypothetical protein
MRPAGTIMAQQKLAELVACLGRRMPDAKRLGSRVSIFDALGRAQ